MIGVYKIMNLITNDIYVGSTYQMKTRKSRHFKDLERQKHHSIILQRAWNKYGSDAFEFSVIEECEIEKLIEREQFYLDSLLPKYNICPTAYSSLGRKDKPERIEQKRQIALKLGLIPPKHERSIVKLDYKTLLPIQIYVSIAEALRDLGKDVGPYTTILSQCASGRRNSAFGFKWKFNGQDYIKKERIPRKMKNGI